MFEWTIIFKSGVIYRIVGDSDNISVDGSTWHIFRDGERVGVFKTSEIAGRERKEVSQ